jgi:hypothetical protein
MPATKGPAGDAAKVLIRTGQRAARTFVDGTTIVVASTKA